MPTPATGSSGSCRNTAKSSDFSSAEARPLSANHRPSVHGVGTCRARQENTGMGEGPANSTDEQCCKGAPPPGSTRTKQRVHRDRTRAHGDSRSAPGGRSARDRSPRATGMVAMPAKARRGRRRRRTQPCFHSGRAHRPRRRCTQSGEAVFFGVLRPSAAWPSGSGCRERGRGVNASSYQKALLAEAWSGRRMAAKNRERRQRPPRGQGSVCELLGTSSLGLGRRVMARG